MMWVASLIIDGLEIFSGQFKINGVEIPPSWVHLLNLRNGVLLAFAQGRS